MPDAPALVGVGRDRAAQAIAARFSRLMNASTSPFGVLGDPASAGVPTAIFFVAYLVARSRDAAPDVVRSLGLLSFAPLLVVVVSSLALIGARARVIAWLAGLPFPLENVNALLNGIWIISLFSRFDRPARQAKAGWYLEVGDGLVKPQPQLHLDPISLKRNKCPPHHPYTLRP